MSDEALDTTARKAFQRALAEVRDVVKNETANTGSYSYSYADLGSVLDAVKEACASHDLSISQVPMHVEGGMFALTTVLYHAGGGTVTFDPIVMPMPRDAQALGSAISYCRRYALLSIFGISADDDDGSEATRQSRNAQQFGGKRSAEELAVTVILAALDDNRKEQVATFVKDAYGGKSMGQINEAKHKEVVGTLIAALATPPPTPKIGDPRNDESPG